MNTFLAGTDVALSIGLNDISGNPLAVTSATYRVLDLGGAELVAATPVEDNPASITVPGSVNALPNGAWRDARVVVVSAIVDGGTVVFQHTYAIMAADPLGVGVNSFQTYANAEFLASLMPNMSGWTNAAQVERIAALIEARNHICRLSFQFSPGDVLEQLTVDEFRALPVAFRAALDQAQLAEANAILGGDPVDDKRREGLVQDVVGESTMVFRQSKPLSLPVCRRALGYLSAYVSFSKRIGRG